MWAALLLAFISCVVAQTPTPCAGPQAFSGRFRNFDRERNYFVEGRIFYDAANKRIREFEFEDLDRTREAFDRLKLYNENKEYSVNLRTRTCNVSEPRPREWVPYGVPSDARFRREGTIGAVGVPNEEVTVAIFDGEYANRDPFFVSVTEPDCFPVELGVFSNASGYFHREFYDIVGAITDPRAFDVPPSCNA